MTIETIPLPEERIRNEEHFQVRATDLYAWPDQELIAEFWFNEHRRRWTWELRHTNLGRLWPKGTATLEIMYPTGGRSHPYINAKFVDLTGDNEHVLASNLGDTVVLGVFPGPLGGSFHPESDFTQEEEDEFLGRDLWRPVK